MEELYTYLYYLIKFRGPVNDKKIEIIQEKLKKNKLPYPTFSDIKIFKTGDFIRCFCSFKGDRSKACKNNYRIFAGKPPRRLLRQYNGYTVYKKCLESNK
jgi:hypothetical protein